MVYKIKLMREKLHMSYSNDLHQAIGHQSQHNVDQYSVNVTRKESEAIRSESIPICIK